MPAEESETLQQGTKARAIARHIEHDIMAEIYKHGQQMPSTRALADEWQTSVATISRAMVLLSERGLVINNARSSRIVNYPSLGASESKTRPKAVLIGGYAGSGKDELGQALGSKTGWAYFSKNAITRKMTEAALELAGRSPNDRESNAYLTLIRPAEYETVIDILLQNLRLGVNMIISAPFIREFNNEAWCRRLSANVESIGAELHVIWVRCDSDTMHQYIRHRGAARDSAKMENWEKYVDSLDFQYKPLLKHRIVDNSSEALPLQQQAADIVKEITAV